MGEKDETEWWDREPPAEEDDVLTLLSRWRSELGDYPLNTAAAQRLRLCIEELESALALHRRTDSSTATGGS
jgi:hypothetical protein